MFSCFKIENPLNIFDRLSDSVKFEDIIPNKRKGAVLIDFKNDLISEQIHKVMIPLVRTTTKYVLPAQKFTDAHYILLREIYKEEPRLEFNNALIEIYNSKYDKMGYHTDQ